MAFLARLWRQSIFEGDVANTWFEHHRYKRKCPFADTELQVPEFGVPLPSSDHVEGLQTELLKLSHHSYKQTRTKNSIMIERGAGAAKETNVSAQFGGGFWGTPNFLPPQFLGRSLRQKKQMSPRSRTTSAEINCKGFLRFSTMRALSSPCLCQHDEQMGG